MFSNIGPMEFLVFILIVLLLFGAKRLPEIGASLGKSIRSFKSSLKEIQEELPSRDELYKDEPKPRPTTSSTSSQNSSPTRNQD